MKGTGLIVAAATAILFGFGSGCVDGGAVLEPAAPAAAFLGNAPEAPGGAGNPRILAAGGFVSNADFANATLTSQGNHCIVQLGGEQVFSGTLEGVSSGTSTVRVFVTCAQLEPPAGFVNYPSVFHSEGVFVGTVEGEQVHADFVYQGRVEAGGQIDARFRFSGGLQGVLQADADATQGGTYEGFVIRR